MFRMHLCLYKFLRTYKRHRVTCGGAALLFVNPRTLKSDPEENVSTEHGKMPTVVPVPTCTR